MDENLAIVITIAIGATVVLVTLITWIRTRYRVVGNGPESAVSTLKDENETLRAQVARLEDRLHVLERIATDPAERTAREIEHLR